MADGQLDSLMDVTLGTFKAIQARNPNVIAWFPQLPYAWLDPCARNFEFNTAVPPWDNKDMRWAVNYAIDRNQIVNVAYEGTTLVSKFFFPAYGPLNKLVDAADAAGVYDKNPIMVHDPAKAKQLIEANGYTMGPDGFYQKNGQQLGMTITTSDTATEHQRIIAVEVEQLQAVGINAVQKNEAEAVWGDNRDFGRFETRQAWDNCGSVRGPAGTHGAGPTPSTARLSTRWAPCRWEIRRSRTCSSKRRTSTCRSCRRFRSPRPRSSFRSTPRTGRGGQQRRTTTFTPRRGG